MNSHKELGAIKYSRPDLHFDLVYCIRPSDRLFRSKIVAVAVPCLLYHIISDKADASAGCDSPIFSQGHVR